jgi:PAS domain S-box-containing protein
MVVFYRSRNTFPGFGHWTVGGSLIAFGYFLMFFRGTVPPGLSIALANLVFPLSAVFYLSGMRRFLGLSDISRVWYAIPVVNAFVCVLFFYSFGAESWRLFFTSLAFSVPHLLTSVLAFRDYPKTKSLFDLIIGTEMALASVIALARALWSFTIPNFEVMMASPLESFFFIAAMVLQIIITVSFIMLNTERFERDLLSAEAALKINVQQLEKAITESKWADEELRRSEEKFSKAFHSSPDAILISRLSDGRLVDVNESFSLISGYSRDEALKSSTIALKLWVNQQDRETVIAALKEKKSVRDYEFSFRIRSGKILNCLYSGEILLIGNEPHLLSVVRDITERKQWEQELQNTLERFYTILSSSYAGLLLVTNENRVEFVNQALCDLFDIEDSPKSLRGLSAPEMIGRLKDLYVEPADVLARMKEALGQDRPLKGEEISIRGGRTYLVDYIPIEIDGKAYGRLWHHTDISERKQAEQEKENLRAQLLQSQKMETMGTLAGGIAHDFNNMLQVIFSYSDMLLAHMNEGDPGYKGLQSILKTAEDAADLVQRIRIFGRKAEMILVPLDLNHQIDQVTKLLSSTLPKMIDIEIHLTKDPVIIKADPSQITQMVMNLAVNANEAMPQGGRLSIETENIVLDNDYCRVHLGVKPGPHVMLTVSDTGRGIDKSLMERIFDPFFSTKMRDYHKGTGLGLSVVQGIVQQHGGHITVESEVGKGTFFRMYFPALEHGIVPEYVETKIPYSAGGTETILLVEDMDLVRELGVTILEKFGYTVLSAGDGQEALDVYEKEQWNISLVILDIIMPRMDGKECLEQLLRINPTVKVIISSGVGKEDLIQDVVKLGAKGAVNKPYGMRQILGMVRQVLDGD